MTTEQRLAERREKILAGRSLPDVVNDEIRRAVLVERERCAVISELSGDDGGPTDICRDGCHGKSARHIAQLIREDPK